MDWRDVYFLMEVIDLTVSTKMEIWMEEVRMHLGMEQYGHKILKMARIMGRRGSGMLIGKWVMFTLIVNMFFDQHESMLFGRAVDIFSF
jgi:hypothetical protein